MNIINAIENFLQINIEKEFSVQTKQRIWQKFLFQLFFAMAISLVLIWAIPIFFESNDDIVMLLFASGGYTGQPELHLVFINFIYGYITYFLYSTLPGIEWYTILFLVILTISFAVVTWRISNMEISKLSKFMFLLIPISLHTYNIHLLQFTTVAAQCAIAAMLLIVCKNKTSQAAGILLFVLASCIRFHSAYLVLLIAFPFIIYNYLENYGISIKCNLFSLFLLISLSFAAKIADTNFYKKDPQWHRYMDYNNLRGGINDNRNAPFVKEVPEGMTDSDYELIQRFFSDPSIISNSHLKEIYLKTKEVSTLKNYLFNIYINLKDYILFLLLLTVIILIILKSTKNRLAQIYLLSSISVLVFALIYISTNQMLKARVFIPALYCFIICTLYVTISKITKINRSIMHLLIMALSFYTLYFMIGNRKVLRDGNLSIKRQETVFKIAGTDFGHLISVEDAPIFNYYSAFHITEKYKQYPFIFTGWVMGIPYNIGKYSSYMDLINKNALFRKKRGAEIIIENLKTSILYHYHLDVEPQILEEYDDFILIRLVTIDKQN